MWEITVLVYCFKIITRRNHLKSWMKRGGLEGRAEGYEEWSQEAVFSWWVFAGSVSGLCNKTWVLLSVPWGNGLPYDKAKVQASKPHNHITALQGFDQVTSVTIPLAKARTSPKSRGCRWRGKRKYFWKIIQSTLRNTWVLKIVCSVFIWWKFTLRSISDPNGDVARSGNSDSLSLLLSIILPFLFCHGCLMLQQATSTVVALHVCYGHWD